MSENILKKIYYDPKTGYKSVKRLYEHVKSLEPSITVKQVRDFLNNQEEYQINKGLHKKSFFKITAPKGYYQADLLFYPQLKAKNKGYSSILSVIEIATRKGYVIPLKNKTEKSVVDGFKLFLEKVTEPILSITTDNGSEFLNRGVQKLFSNHKIQHMLAQVNDHNKMAIVERFNRSMKNYLRKYFTANNTYNWIDVINDFIDNYNNAYHSTIKTSPNKITESQAEKLRTDAIQHNASIMENIKFKKGDIVRVAKPKAIFDKEGERYNTTTYMIEDLQGYKYQVRNTKTNHVSKRLYSVNELSKVDKVEYHKPIEKPSENKSEVIKEYKTGVKLRKEGVDPKDIIGKRQRKDITYKPLAKGVYEVERITSKRMYNGRVEYLVYWKGYANPTWESAKNLKNARESVEEYEKM